jgi:Ca2+/Na+ antiporter
MKLPQLDTYTRAALILIGLSIFIMVVFLATNRGNITSAILVLIAFASFVAGLFIFSFSGEEQIDHNVAAALAVPYTINISRVLADMGVSGPAHFIPVPDDGTFPAPVMQFNPVGTNVPDQFNEDFTFLMRQDSSGILTVPSGVPLLTMMEQNHSITIPATEHELFKAIREVNQDLLEVAGEVTITRSGNSILMTLMNYQLISGCIAAKRESPMTCLVAPCPICSLAGVMVTMGLGKRCFMEQVLVDKEEEKVEVYIGVKN